MCVFHHMVIDFLTNQYSKKVIEGLNEFLVYEDISSITTNSLSFSVAALLGAAFVIDPQSLIFTLIYKVLYPFP